jgi:hypothetical protein
MKSIFLEGLTAARDLIKEKGIEALEALILEHEKGVIETAAVDPRVEIR